MADETNAELFAEIGAGLLRGEFEPAYQPILALPSRDLLGFEALARWRRPGRGLLTPGAFMPALQDPGLEARISEVIALRVVEDAASLRVDGLDFGQMFINLAEKQLHDAAFADRLLREATAAGLGAADLMVEIRETARLTPALVDDLDGLKRLASAGAGVALDDFGTGFASLTHLRMPFLKRVKLDLSLTQGVSSDAGAAAIMRRTAQLTKDLGLQLIAEGVEDAATEAVLIEAGCDGAQGYFFARPAPLAEIIVRLRGDGWRS